MRGSRKFGIALAALAAALPAEAVDKAGLKAWTGPATRSCASAAGADQGGEAAAPFHLENLAYDPRIEADTDDPAARRWFAQGLRLIWAYDEAEAIRAFREAQKRAPDCALCHWGEALGLSPTLNLLPPYVDVDAASAAIGRASQIAQAKLKAGKPWKHRDRDLGLIDAIRVRAPASGDAFDNEGYVRSMAALAHRFPDEYGVLVLAADSQIVRWSASGTPLQQAQGWLEKVIARDPGNKSAVHFYIHLADIVEKPELAVPYAGRLEDAGPGASHLIHMASHSYYGVGRFEDAVKANRNAIDAYGIYERRDPVFSAYRRYLYAHDHHYAIESALMRGDAANALDVAAMFNRRFAAKDPLFRIRAAHYAAPWYAFGLHANPDEVLRMRAPATGFNGDVFAMATAAYHYARGEAQARKGSAAGVAAEAAAIAALLDGPQGRALGDEGNALAAIGKSVLEGRAAMLGGRPGDAAAAYRAAMIVQANAGLQFDPPPFWYPVRRSLAAALLEAGDPHGARRQLEASLQVWREDPLALYAMSRVEERLGNPAEAARYLARAERAWAGGAAIRSFPLARV